tara:strand:+ start:139 stop:606 length:468 start_codon:yes stop_codon:yes gene_type:complete
MTVCSGFLPPPIGWVLFAVVMLVLGFFLLYRPFKNKSKTSIKIVSVISFVLLLLILFFVFAVIVNDTCYYAFKPKFEKNLNIEVTSQEQAKQLFYDHLSQEYNQMKNQNKTQFDEFVNPALDRLTESEESFSIYFIQYEYILHKDGKLYKKWMGD